MFKLGAKILAKSNITLIYFVIVPATVQSFTGILVIMIVILGKDILDVTIVTQIYFTVVKTKILKK